MEQMDEETKALLKLIGDFINRTLNGADGTDYRWALLVINASGKADMTGNGNRDVMLHALRQAVDKLQGELGPPTVGNA